MGKKIMHILSSNSYSGAENVVINIINSLSNDYDFAYVSPEGPIQEVLKEKNIIHIPIKSMNPYYLNMIFRKWKPDIIHAHDFRASVSSALSLYPCYKISHLHQNPLWIRKINLYSLVYFITCLFYDKIVVVSNEILEEAVFLKLFKYKSYILQNNIDINNILKLSDTGKSNKKYDVAFIGRLTEAKDPLRFVRVINKVIAYRPGTRIVIVGDGILRNEVKTLIMQLELNTNVEMMGFLSNPYEILNNSKLLVMTSKWEGFGIVAVEAMALGKPVFASPVGGLKSIIKEDCGGFCETDEDFIKNILESLSNDDYYKKMSYNSKKNARKFGNKKRWIRRIRYLYEH
ncbi:glycosyltransferase [Anaerosalibacter bizertensis]|uniref:glycosyltransferase n=1 Tax=Anaerosalibacter bizertensis TaxID=932217 RepID=UPI001C0F0D60|nr:glycosyltransferase [Anaerosalibacter bizertensis]MBU5294097.1 glycosyltransferase [Anaerosalibacter bizertensis]